jgi:trigger factor
MQRELDQRLRETSKSNVLDALHDAHTFELPKTLVDQEAHALQHEAMRRMGTEDHAKAPPISGFKPLAEKRVRLSLLVQELIGRHQIALDRAKVEERIQEIASPYEVPEEAAQIYRANKDMMAQIESSVLEGQIVDFVIDSAKPNRTKLGFDEFMNMQDAE